MKQENTNKKGPASLEGERELLTVVVPVFNEVETIDVFYTRMKKVLDSLSPMSYELIFVDDGSRDGSFAKLTSLADHDTRVRVAKLSRNFGHQNAVTAGVDTVRGDAVVIIDADLQDPPEVIPSMIRKWREGYEVMYTREKRYAGETKYPFGKMIKFSLDGITSFSHAPLKIATWLGYGVSLIALLYTMIIIVEKFMGMTVPGFASIMAGMAFPGGVQLIFLGILGKYFGRIFNENKGRPIYVLEEIYEKTPTTDETRIRNSDGPPTQGSLGDSSSVPSAPDEACR